MSRLKRRASRASGGFLDASRSPFGAARPALRGRRARLLAGSTAILILAGCGHSSSTSSTSTAKSASAGVSARGASTSTSSVQPPPSSTSSAKVTGSSGQLTATMRAGTHNPRAGHPWPVRFTVTRAGSPAKASVGYEFLFAGQVVAHRSHYSFAGSFSDIVVWPSQSVGYPLTFRAVIVSGGTRIYLDYPVQVNR